MRLASSEAASSSSIGIIIAAAAFAGAFVVAELLVAQPAALDPRGARFDTQASTALDILVGDDGVTSTGVPWTQDPDHMTRFGLAKDGQPSFLDYVKIRALRNGTLNASANNAPDYAETKAALGISEGDFHLRSYPALPSMADPRFVKEAHGRIAYLAHVAKPVDPVSLSLSYTSGATWLNVSATVKNEGSRESAYNLVFDLAQQSTGATIATENRNTRLLLPEDQQVVWINYTRLASWSASITGVRVDVQDAYANWGVDESGVRVGPQWVVATPPSGGAAGTSQLAISADQPFAPTGSAVGWTMLSYDGNGVQTAGSGRFVLVGPNAKEWVNTTSGISWTAKKATSWACANCTAVGNYTATLWDSGVTRATSDIVYVAPGPVFNLPSAPDPRATLEVGYVQDLVANFNPTPYDAITNPQGDIFYDDHNGGRDLADLLSRYDYVVIGSEVDQTSLTPNAVKSAIADWVSTQGGNLIVLGTKNANSNWLEPIYKASIRTADGGISAPDPTHPILLSPEHLQWDRYNDNLRGWDIRSDQPFTPVLRHADLSDTLAVANPGAYNDGTVTLTSYQPGSLTTPQDDAEAEKLMHNLLSQGYTMLFIDYGPPIPSGVVVGSDSRLVAVQHPNVPGETVEVRLILYLFG